MSDGPDANRQSECADAGKRESWPTRFDLIWSIAFFATLIVEQLASALNLFGYIADGTERMLGTLWHPFCALVFCSMARDLRRTQHPRWGAVLYSIAALTIVLLVLDLVLLVIE